MDHHGRFVMRSVEFYPPRSVWPGIGKALLGITAIGLVIVTGFAWLAVLGVGQ